MQHCDDEGLSLLALGEPGTPEAEQHLATCPLCSAQLSALRQVVTAARDARPGSTRVAPPPALWHRIATEAGVGVNARHEEVLRHSQDDDASPAQDALPAQTPTTDNAGPRDNARPTRRALRTVDGPRPGDAPPNMSRRPDLTRRLDRPRRLNGAGRPGVRRPDRPGLLLAAACLVIGLVAGGLGTWLATGDRRPAAEAAQVVAATRLAGLALAPSAIGEADVVSTSTGRRLDLDVQRLGTPQGFYEVWLIDPTVTKMVPIGVLSGSQGRFALPAGVDLSSYPLLDISIQPLNGDPKHSGRSVLRGTFKS